MFSFVVMLGQSTMNRTTTDSGEVGGRSVGLDGSSVDGGSGRRTMLRELLGCKRLLEKEVGREAPRSFRDDPAAKQKGRADT
jgi:hypothetical protein